MSAAGDIFRKYNSGWLEKKGSFVKNWKKRWFILKYNCLEYYEDDTLKSQKGMIDINSSTKILYRDGKTHAFKFGIVTGGKMLEISASNSETRLNWIGSIQEVIMYHNEPDIAEIVSIPSKEENHSVQDPNSNIRRTKTTRLTRTSSETKNNRSRLSSNEEEMIYDKSSIAISDSDDEQDGVVLKTSTPALNKGKDVKNINNDTSVSQTPSLEQTTSSKQVNETTSLKQDAISKQVNETIANVNKISEKKSAIGKTDLWGDDDSSSSSENATTKSKKVRDSIDTDLTENGKTRAVSNSVNLQLWNDDDDDEDDDDDDDDSDKVQGNTDGMKPTSNSIANNNFTQNRSSLRTSHAPPIPIPPMPTPVFALDNTTEVSSSQIAFSLDNLPDLDAL